MSSSALIKLIEANGEAWTAESLKDLMMNPRTPSFRGVPRDEVSARIGALHRNLVAWLRGREDDAVRAAYEDWGRRRFTQHVPLSEIVYAIMMSKEHLRRRAREEGLAGELREAEGQIGEFFDRAFYYLVRGYEMQAMSPPAR